jgi:hypothetical protein
MQETGILTAEDQQRVRRRLARIPPVSRAKVTNDPLAALNGNSAAGRRLRDLYHLAAAEIGGKLTMREQLACMTWARLQQEFEGGNVLLAAEVRHAWRGVLKAKREPRRVERRSAPIPSMRECL